MTMKSGNSSDLYSCNNTDRCSAASQTTEPQISSITLASSAIQSNEYVNNGAMINAYTACCSEVGATEIETTEPMVNRTVVKQSHFSRDRLFNGNVSSTAHAFFDFIKFKRNSESINENSDRIDEFSTIANHTTNNLDTINKTNNGSAINAEIDHKMRLNVPAADSNGVDMPIITNCISTSTKVTTTNNRNNIIENGTLAGAIVSHPSLTIHVNQSAIDQQTNLSQCPTSSSSIITTTPTQNVVNQSSGVSIVNCYRAVPVQVLNSSVDQNHCDQINSLSNTVHIVNDNNIIETTNNIKLMKRIERKCEKSDSVFTNEINNDDLVNALDNTINSTNEMGNIDVDNLTSTIIPTSTSQHRTFISTEAQTDDLQQMDAALIDNGQRVSPVVVVQSTIGTHSKANEHRRNGSGSGSSETREQRRRERRERRQARNATRQQHIHLSTQTNGPLQPHHSNCEILPDILHSHVPPPYTTLPLPPLCQISAASPPSSVLLPGPPSALITPIPVGIADDGRYTFPLPIMRR